MTRRRHPTPRALAPSPGTPGEGSGEGLSEMPTTLDAPSHPRPSPRPAHRERGRSGFTLIEVLAAMVLIGIVMPVVMQGIMVATRSGATARHRTEAAILANSKLAELTVTGQWDGGSMSGDFGADQPGYKWLAAVGDWAGDVNQIGMEQLDVTVTWIDRGQPTSVTVSGLVYVRPVPAS